ncbi:MAG: hypothetical protein WCP86_11400, partial [bacterium]
IEKGFKPRRADILFTRREIREHTGWPNQRVARYIGQLVALEYLLTHTGRNGQRFVYTLCYESRESDVDGLILGWSPRTVTKPSQDLRTTFSPPSQSENGTQVVDGKDDEQKPSHLNTKG